MLEIQGLGKTYPNGKRALEGVTLSAGAGVLGLLGPNGAGKSTLISILATVTKPSFGTFVWKGVDGVRDPFAVRRTLGYLPQDFGVYDRLTAREFLLYLGRLKGLSGVDLSRRLEGLFTLVNLHGAADRRLGGFLGGMRQRVGIAQALLGDPELLIVDEPTVGLDPEERVRFRNLLAELAHGRLVILSTHIVSDLEAVATTIAVIRAGHVVTIATPEDLLAQAEGKVFTAVVSPESVADVQRRVPVSNLARRAGGVFVRFVGDGNALPHATPVEPTLEDAYLLASGARVTSLATSMGAQVRAEVATRLRSPATSVALLASLFLVLCGFYFVAGSVRKDRESGVGAILAATPLTKAAYLLGKLAANAAYLAVLSLSTIPVGFYAFVRFGTGRFALAPMLLPFLAVALPAVVFIAAMAVLFDVTPGLRGRGGLVIWFFVSMFLLVQLPMFLAGVFSPGTVRQVGFAGVASLHAVILRAVPPEWREHVSTGLTFSNEPIVRVPWPGVDLTAGFVLGCLSQVLWAAVPLGLAVLVFDRFDPARRLRRARRDRAPAAAPEAAPASFIRLEDLAPARPGRRSLARAVGAEVRLLWKTAPLLKWALPILAVLALVVPETVVKGLAAAFLLLLAPVISEAAAREDLAGTRALVLSQPLVPRSMVLFKAGALATFVGVLGAPLVLRFGMGSAALGAAFAAGLLFVVAFAAGAGALTRGGKLFSGLYLAGWYVAVNGVPSLDFTGVFVASPAVLPSLVFAVFGSALTAIAVFVEGRRRLEGTS